MTVTFYFVKLKNFARSVLNIDTIKYYHGENLADLMEQKIIASIHIRHNWDILTKERIDNEDKQKYLFRRITRYWIKSRGNAFTKAWVYSIKDQACLSKKGEHSLRKQLSS